MPGFDKKRWLDDHVLPSLQPDPTHPSLSLYAVFWNGHPPKDVLVFATAPPATTEPFDPLAWPSAVKRLLESGFVFDFTREQQMVKDPDGSARLIALFGGDGAPLFDKSGACSVRLFRKIEDGRNLILQIGCRYADGLDAAVAVKAFFALFDQNAMTVCQTFAAPFGQA